MSTKPTNRDGYDPRITFAAERTRLAWIRAVRRIQARRPGGLGIYRGWMLSILGLDGLPPSAR